MVKFNKIGESMKLSFDEILKATNACIIKNENINEEFSFSTDTRTIKKMIFIFH